MWHLILLIIFDLLHWLLSFCENHFVISIPFSFNLLYRLLLLLEKTFGRDIGCAIYMIMDYKFSFAKYKYMCHLCAILFSTFKGTGNLFFSYIRSVCYVSVIVKQRVVNLTIIARLYFTQFVPPRIECQSIFSRIDSTCCVESERIVRVSTWRGRTSTASVGASWIDIRKLNFCIDNFKFVINLMWHITFCEWFCPIVKTSTNDIFQEHKASVTTTFPVILD